jgi:hypothetical protein
MRRACIVSVVFALLGLGTTAVVGWAGAAVTQAQLHAVKPRQWIAREQPVPGGLVYVSRYDHRWATEVEATWTVWEMTVGPEVDLRSEPAIPAWVPALLWHDPTVVVADSFISEDNSSAANTRWCAQGWPLRCFRCASSVSYWESMELPAGVRGCAHIELFGETRTFAYEPLWPGFLINTAFYGVILWALWFTPGAVRRGVRRRRGACVRCGYDLRGGGLTACPECGAAGSLHSTLNRRDQRPGGGDLHGVAVPAGGVRHMGTSQQVDKSTWKHPARKGGVFLWGRGETERLGD